MASIEKFLFSQAEVALMEDIGPGDITTLGCIDDEPATAEITAKGDGVLAGLMMVEVTFRKLNNAVELNSDLKDGSPFKKGDKIVQINGSRRAIITGERTALNFLGHLSGIATLTSMFVEKVKDTKVVILDTRKTTPGLRHLEKHAVTCGGGKNHRFGLYDMILIKDNHIASCGSVVKAVERARNYLAAEQFRKQYVVDPAQVIIEVEIVNDRQLKEAVQCGIKRLLLDNQTIEHLLALVKTARSLAADLQLEASGNVNLHNVAAIAKTGVDFISIGALTHSAPSSDFSLNIIS